METTLVNAGYPALLLISFLAATLVPFGSEWLLVLQIAAGGNIVASVLVATTGNLLGALTTYWIGLRGSTWLIERVLRISPEQQDRATRFYQRYGSWSLLLSWVPVVGDPLCLIGGLVRVSLPRFTALVTLGKCARYTTVAWLTMVGEKTLVSNLLGYYL